MQRCDQREFVHAVQTRRKDLSCDYTDRIEVGVVTESDELRAAVAAFADYVKAEVLAIALDFVPLPGVEATLMSLAGHALALYVKIVPGE